MSLSSFSPRPDEPGASRRPSAVPAGPGRAAVAPRDAATLILLRDGCGNGQGNAKGHTFEVLLLCRSARSPFMPSAWVFPGGTVDPGDASLPAQCWSGDRQRLTRITGRPVDIAFALAVAAVRETFEEAGLLLAHDAAGAPADPVTVRGAPRAPEAFVAWLQEHRMRLDLAALTPWSRWITPVVRPRRYDTMFFVADAPPDQVPVHDPVETTGARWISPRAALRAAEEGKLSLVYPTIKNLERLAAFDDRAAVHAAAAAQQRLPVSLPHVVLDDHGKPLRIVGPDDPDYPWSAYPELEERDGPPAG